MNKMFGLCPKTTLKLTRGILETSFTLYFYIVFSKGLPVRFTFCGVQPLSSRATRWVEGSFKNTDKASKSCISSAVCRDALLMACVAIKHDFTWIKHANRYRSACIYVNASEFINGGEMLKFGH